MGVGAPNCITNRLSFIRIPSRPSRLTINYPTTWDPSVDCYLKFPEPFIVILAAFVWDYIHLECKDDSMDMGTPNCIINRLSFIWIPNRPSKPTIN